MTIMTTMLIKMMMMMIIMMANFYCFYWAWPSCMSPQWFLRLTDFIVWWKHKHPTCFLLFTFHKRTMAFLFYWQHTKIVTFLAVWHSFVQRCTTFDWSANLLSCLARRTALKSEKKLNAKIFGDNKMQLSGTEMQVWRAFSKNLK